MAAHKSPLLTAVAASRLPRSCSRAARRAGPIRLRTLAVRRRGRGNRRRFGRAHKGRH